MLVTARRILYSKAYLAKGQTTKAIQCSAHNLTFAAYMAAMSLQVMVESPGFTQEVLRYGTKKPTHARDLELDFGKPSA